MLEQQRVPGPGEDESITAAVADQLVRVVESAAEHLRTVPSAEASRPRAPGKWSKKEELGHLVDSASNNHHRIVRARFARALEFPGYDQEAWVDLQDYRACGWSELVELWRLYNRHLARVIARVPLDELSTPCRIGSDQPVTLAFLIEDYLSHLQHHLRLMDVPG